LAARPRKADKDYFAGKTLQGPDGNIIVSDDIARKIERYLMKNDFTNDNDEITPEYHQAKAGGSLPDLPFPFTQGPICQTAAQFPRFNPVGEFDYL
jgi:type III restriction enzyme